MIDFRSDNVLGGSPEVLQAIERASPGTQTSYGGDEITARLRRRCCELFGTDVDIFPVVTGTAGNALAISAMTPPWGAVFCHEDAHIEREELGATEFFSGGAKLITVRGDDGKLHPADLQSEIDRVRKRKKSVVPACVSITNATEAGTVYSPEEMRALIDVARENGLRAHVDGARWANAVVAKSVTPEGVDILTFGGTKNGTLNADLIVVFRRELSENLALRMHRSGHRPSKMRFLSAQFEAYVTDDLWLRNARQANAMAARLRDGLAGKVEIVRPVQANIVFVRIDREAAAELNGEGFLFGEWPLFGPDAYRIVTGFSTTESEVDRFVSAFQTLASNASTSSK